MSHDHKVLSDPELFAHLTANLTPADAVLFSETRHGRVETAATGKEFVVYRMQGRRPSILSNISVVDLSIDDSGASTEILDLTTKERVVVGYQPQRLFDYPIFFSLPASLTMRWRVGYDDGRGFMTWPVYMRTQSRRHLRELGVTYCETLKAFHEEFTSAAG